MAMLIGCGQLVLAADQLTPRREVRPLHKLHQLLGCEILVDERHAGLNHLGQIVRWNRGCHPNRNALRAIYQQVRKACREDDRLKQAPVVVRTKGDRLLGKLDQELIGELLKARLGVAHRRRRIAIRRAEIAAAIHERLPQGEGLGHPD